MRWCQPEVVAEVVRVVEMVAWVAVVLEVLAALGARVVAVGQAEAVARVAGLAWVLSGRRSGPGQQRQAKWTHAGSRELLS